MQSEPPNWVEPAQWYLMEYTLLYHQYPHLWASWEDYRKGIEQLPYKFSDRVRHTKAGVDDWEMSEENSNEC